MFSITYDARRSLRMEGNEMLQILRTLQTTFTMFFAKMFYEMKSSDKITSEHPISAAFWCKSKHFGKKPPNLKKKKKKKEEEIRIFIINTGIFFPKHTKF
jgi:hypothetical protein